MNKERILRKIRALIEMASRQEGNEEEAMVAAGQLEKMLAKYNLELADITPEQVKSEVVSKRWTGMKWTENRIPRWANRLAIAVAKLCDTFCVLESADSNDGHVRKAQANFAFVGMDVDVQATVMMFGYLYQTINRLSDEHVKNTYVPKGKARTYRDSFRLGASTRLRERILEIMAEREAEKAAQVKTGTSLVVIKQQAIGEYLGRKPEYGVSKRTQDIDSMSYSAGQSAGNGISLNKQLN